ncbi:MAG: hypothetical protein U0414_01080 [Polyangiaceae bacterium]
MRVVAVAALALSGLAVACGARTSLDEPADAQGGAASASSSVGSTSGASTSSSATAAQSSSTGPPCTSDRQCDDGVSCTIDACLPDGCAHEPDDAFCSDGAFCTVDHCDPRAGCENTHSDAICDDGIPCTTDVCDADDDACHNDPCDALCTDSVFCNGVERCDSLLGCTAGPPSCDLDLACSADTCTEATQQCKHAIGLGCAPNVHLLVTDSSGALLDLRPYTGVSTVIATAGTTHLDIAILPGPPARWFALDATTILELVPNSNTTKTFLPGVSANSLAAGPDGFLYAAGTEVFRINPNSGASSTIGALPPGESSSGDIVFFDGEMIISTDGPCGGGLARFDLATGTSALLGGDGLGCVYGLATKFGTLFLLNCDGTIGAFDPSSGVARILTTTNVTAYGADAL